MGGQRAAAIQHSITAQRYAKIPMCQRTTSPVTEKSMRTFRPAMSKVVSTEPLFEPSLRLKRHSTTSVRGTTVETWLRATTRSPSISVQATLLAVPSVQLSPHPAIAVKMTTNMATDLAYMKHQYSQHALCSHKEQQIHLYRTAPSSAFHTVDSHIVLSRQSAYSIYHVRPSTQEIHGQAQG